MLQLKQFFEPLPALPGGRGDGTAVLVCIMTAGISLTALPEHCFA
jgi:hypothetical protein